MRSADVLSFAGQGWYSISFGWILLDLADLLYPANMGTNDGIVNINLKGAFSIAADHF